MNKTKTWIIHTEVGKRIGYSLTPCPNCKELHKVPYVEPYAYRTSVFDKYKARYPEEFNEDDTYKLELVPWAVAIIKHHKEKHNE